MDWYVSCKNQFTRFDLCRKFNTQDYDMQLLCRPWKSMQASPKGLVCSLALALTPLWGWAGESNQDKLFQQVRKWEADNRHVMPEQIEVAPLDSRVQVQACANELLIDHPFVSPDTVRVRCPAEANSRSGPARTPNWQLYLQVSSNKAPAPTDWAPKTPASPLRPVLVAKQVLLRGSRIDASMLEETFQPVAETDTQLLSRAKDIDLVELTHDIPAGGLLHTYDLRRTLLVKQGQAALLSISTAGAFQVTVQAEAQQDGYLGDQIRLKNSESGRIFSGVVTGPNLLRGL